MSLFLPQKMFQRRVIVFDLDGVLFRTPSKETVNDPAFWMDYWNNERPEPNPEMIKMYHDYDIYGLVTPVILTARPTVVESPTLKALENVGIHVPLLFMMDHDPDQADWQTTGFWKRDVVREWIQAGVDVWLVIEDYKPNADAIRQVTTVLLYESRRSVIDTSAIA